MIKKILKLFKIIKLIELMFILFKTILIGSLLLIITIIETIRYPANLHIKSIKNKLKNRLKFQLNQLTIRLFENIFSISIPLTIISYLLNTRVIIQKLNDNINFYIDKVFDEIITSKLKSILKKE